MHEHRLAGLIALCARFAQASAIRTRDEAERERAVDFYLDAVRRGRVNNGDLVDSSAEFVLGEWLVNRPRHVIDELVSSDDLWMRRVGVIATFAFIKRGDASTMLSYATEHLEPARRAAYRTLRRAR